MPVPAPVSPAVFKRVLELCGFEVVDEDEFNWGLYKADAELRVVVLPKEGETLSLTIMMAVLDNLKIDNATYSDLVGRASAA